MTRMPTLFVSHGSPEIAVRDTPANRFLVQLGETLPPPRAIVVLSAHWETDVPAVATADMPETIYDFGRMFDQRLWEIRYDAPGAPMVAESAASLIEEAFGVPVTRDAARGRDHGVWTPLHLMYPAQDVPVAQVSIQPDRDAAYHHRLGEALRPLREDGVLLMASGAITHNLAAFRGQPIDAPEPEWVAAFRGWMRDRLEAGDRAALIAYRDRAPFAIENHPEDEHLLPIFAALGASTAGDRISRLHDSVQHGVIGMDVYRFG